MTAHLCAVESLAEFIAELCQSSKQYFVRHRTGRGNPPKSWDCTQNKFATPSARRWPIQLHPILLRGARWFAPTVSQPVGAFYA